MPYQISGYASSQATSLSASMSAFASDSHISAILARISRGFTIGAGHIYDVPDPGSYTLTPGFMQNGNPQLEPGSYNLNEGYIRLDLGDVGTENGVSLTSERLLFHELVHLALNIRTPKGDTSDHPWDTKSNWAADITPTSLGFDEELAIAAENLIYVPSKFSSPTASDIRIGHQSNYSGTIGNAGISFFQGYGPATLTTLANDDTKVTFSAANPHSSVSKTYFAPRSEILGVLHTHYILDTMALSYSVLSGNVANSVTSRFLSDTLHAGTLSSPGIPSYLSPLGNLFLHAPGYSTSATIYQSSIVALGNDHYFDGDANSTLDVHGVVAADRTPATQIAINRAGISYDEIILGASKSGARDLIVAGLGNDLIISDSSNHNSVGRSILMGGDGDDIIVGGSYAESYGDAGNDILVARQGSNRYDGGAGNDLLFLRNLDHGVDIDFSQNKMTVNGVQSYVGSLETIVGTIHNDVFHGNPGQLYGGAGADTFHLTSISKVDGGEGYDVVDFSSTTSVTLTLNTEFRFTSIEGVIGSSGTDYLNMRTFGQYRAVQSVHAGNGDDRIILGSNTYAWGEAGNDTFEIAETGSGFIDGGDDYDTIDFSNVGGPVMVDLDDRTVAHANGTNGWSSIEAFLNPYGRLDIFGSDDADQIIGNHGPGFSLAVGDVTAGDGDDNIVAYGALTLNYFAGGEGDDTIVNHGWGRLDGGNGDDTLTGTSKENWFIGGAGNDTMVSTSGMNSNFDGGTGSNSIVGGSGEFDIAHYTAFGALTITGGAGTYHVSSGYSEDDLVGIEYLFLQNENALYHLATAQMFYL